MLPGDFLQVSTSRSSVAQGIDDNSKGAGPRDRSRVSPALGATLVAQNNKWELFWGRLYHVSTLEYILVLQSD
jgi:hypothetical protein